MPAQGAGIFYFLTFRFEPTAYTLMRVLRLTIFISLSICFNVDAQEQYDLGYGYYMVVAAYKATTPQLALRYTNQLNNNGYQAAYGLSAIKNMYFVYIKQYNSYSTAIADIRNIRTTTPFNDAWVHVHEINRQAQPIAKEPEVQTNTKDQLETTPVIKPIPEVGKVDSIRYISKNKSEQTTTIAEADDGKQLVYFEALDARTQLPVDVSINFRDPYTNKLLDTLRAQTAKRISPPVNQENLIEVSVNTFGWLADAISFNFEQPINDSTEYFLKYSGDTLLLLFDMHRMRRGDIQTLYNVYFIPDAALMKESSKAQLMELLAMMNENPNLKIRLHGHTNGNSRGEYYRLIENDTVFFALNRQHEKTSGSAKQLSFDRANTIKRYLVHHGVSEARVEVKGWGGRKMIYDKMSKANIRNIRVEVEVIEE